MAAGAKLRPGPGETLDNIAAVATADADATYGTAERDLINELKAQFNALLTELQDSGYMK